MTLTLDQAMSLTIDFEPRKQYLRATVHGSYTLRSAQDVYDQAIKTAVAVGQSRILIDASAATGAPTQDERYMLGLFVAAEQRILASRVPPLEVQVAVVGQRPLVDPDRFGETVAVNRGAKLKVSERVDEALAWLGVSAGH